MYCIWILTVKQTIFADNTYSKPFFLTYVNTSLFILPLFTILLTRLWRLWRIGKLAQITSLRSLLNHLDSSDPKLEEQRILEDEHALVNERERESSEGEDEGYSEEPNSRRGVGLGPGSYKESSRLGLKATARLSFEFCLLWVGFPFSSIYCPRWLIYPQFLANYFAMACLQYTTVGSTTILTSTSGTSSPPLPPSNEHYQF